MISSAAAAAAATAENNCLEPLYSCHGPVVPGTIRTPVWSHLTIKSAGMPFTSRS